MTDSDPERARLPPPGWPSRPLPHVPVADRPARTRLGAAGGRHTAFSDWCLRDRSSLAGAHDDRVGHGLVVGFVEMFQLEAGEDEGVHEVGQRQVPHAADFRPDPVDTPPRCCGVPASLSVRGVHDAGTVVSYFDVGTVEAGMDAVEQETPTRLEHPVNLPQHRREVVDVSRGPGADHGGKGVRGEGKAFGVALNQAVVTPCCEAELIGRQLDADRDPTGRSDDLEVASCAAPDIKAKSTSRAELLDQNLTPVRSGLKLRVVPVRDAVVARTARTLDVGRQPLRSPLPLRPVCLGGFKDRSRKPTVLRERRSTHSDVLRSKSLTARRHCTSQRAPIASQRPVVTQR